jgi:hypothetical protein
MKKVGTVNFERLIEWLEGRLSEGEAQDVAGQVAAAEVTQADVAWLRTIYQASQNLVTAELPTAITEALQHRFAAYARSRHLRADGDSLWQRLVATLTFDSQAELSTGTRAAASENQRQLVYQTELGTVVCTLQWRSHDRQIDLLGQFLPIEIEETSLARVLLLKEKNEFDSTITDDLGEFTLTALPAGLYDLVLTTHQYEITVPSFEISI